MLEQGDRIWVWQISAVSVFLAINVLSFLAILRKWHVRDVDFRNAFRNEKSKRLVYAKLSRYQFSGITPKDKLMVVWRGLYGPHNAARIRFKLCSPSFRDAGSKQLRNMPYILHCKDVAVTCYVGALLIFSKLVLRIERLNCEMMSWLVLRDLGGLKKFLNIEIDWSAPEAMESVKGILWGRPLAGLGWSS